MLIFQIKIIVSSEKWFNYAVTFLEGEMPKISAGRTTLSLLHSRLVWGGALRYDWTTLNGEKRGWPKLK